MEPANVNPVSPGVGNVVVMGTAGCGKSSLAIALSDALGWRMLEGDAFHSAENIERMRGGEPLTDADRASWLERLGQALGEGPGPVVLTCSALKRRYRDVLRQASPGLRFIFLDITLEEALRRVRLRRDTHFFNPELVGNQFEILERPDAEPDVLALDATEPLPVLRERAVEWLVSTSSSTRP